MPRLLLRPVPRPLHLGVVALLVALLPVAASGEASSRAELDAAAAARVDTLFADHQRSDAPGGVAAVIQDGRVAHTVAYGMADLERGVAVTPGSVFEIGSVSKQFTAMCVLLLEHDGKLSLDDAVRRHVPELPDYGSTITLRHLLHHTSGVRDVETLIPLAGWHYPSYYRPDQVLDLVTRQKALNFEPGSQHLYSNSGYLLLAKVVERVSGKSLRAFAAERIFAPLGMGHTVFFDDPGQVIADRALPYEQEGDGYRMALWYLPFTGPSGLYTNVEDLARWDANFYDNVLGGGAALIDSMQTPGTLSNGERLTYAAGLVIGGDEQHREIRHGGAWMGYRAGMQRYPDRGMTVIQLSNAASIPVSSRAILDQFLGTAAGTESEPQPEVTTSSGDAAPTIELAPELLASYQGTYWNETDQLLRTIELRDGALHYVRGETSATRLAALEPGRFVMVGPDVHVEVAFAPASEGGGLGMTVAVGAEEPLVFQPLTPLSSVGLADVAGVYWSDELERELRLTVEGDRLTAHWADEPDPKTAVALAADDLLVRGFVPVPWFLQDVRLRTRRDTDGIVDGLTLSCDMVRGVAFAKRQ